MAYRTDIPDVHDVPDNYQEYYDDISGNNLWDEYHKLQNEIYAMDNVKEVIHQLKRHSTPFGYAMCEMDQKSVHICKALEKRDFNYLFSAYGWKPYSLLWGVGDVSCSLQKIKANASTPLTPSKSLEKA